MVAVVAGDGMRQVFVSLGASRIVAGGQSMNPSVQQLAEAAATIPGDTVVLLPNNPNVLLVCQHLHEVVAKRVIVVPSHTMPQGIAALLAVDLSDGVGDQAAAMQQADLIVRGTDIVVIRGLLVASANWFVTPYCICDATAVLEVARGRHCVFSSDSHRITRNNGSDLSSQIHTFLYRMNINSTLLKHLNRRDAADMRRIGWSDA